MCTTASSLFLPPSSFHSHRPSSSLLLQSSTSLIKPKQTDKDYLSHGLSHFSHPGVPSCTWNNLVSFSLGDFVSIPPSVFDTLLSPFASLTHILLLLLQSSPLQTRLDRIAFCPYPSEHSSHICFSLTCPPYFHQEKDYTHRAWQRPWHIAVTQ